MCENKNNETNSMDELCKELKHTLDFLDSEDFEKLKTYLTINLPLNTEVNIIKERLDTLISL